MVYCSQFFVEGIPEYIKLNDIIRWYGPYTYRPLAFWSDAFFAQWFWPVMWVMLLFYTVLHFATVYLFHDVLKKVGIRFGAVGVLIASLTPMILEAVYWIGASSRLVAGMFFSVLSIQCLLCFIRRGEARRRRYLVCYILFNILSTGFYEQIVIFNLLFSALIIALVYQEMNETRPLKALLVGTPLLSTLIIGVYYLLFIEGGSEGTRGELASSFTTQFKSAMDQLGNLLWSRNIETSSDAIRAFGGIGLNPGQMLILLFVAACAVLLLLAGVKLRSRPEPAGGRRYILRILAGLLLTFGPLSLFFVIRHNAMPPRVLYPALFGMAMVVDTLLEWLGGAVRFRGLSAVVAGLLLVPVFVINVVEVNNYRLIDELDEVIADNLVAAFAETGEEDDATLVIFNAKPRYADTSNRYYENITSSSWAILGRLNANYSDYYFTSALTVREDLAFANSEFERYRVLFGIGDDLRFFPLTLEGDVLYLESGEQYGTLESLEGDRSVFHLTE